MATGLLVGTQNIGPNYQQGAGTVILNKWQAVATGTCTQIQLYSATAGNVKVAIYADNGGVPGSRLAKQDTSTAVSSWSWNTINLEASCNIVSGNWYWLALIVDTTGSAIWWVDTGRAVNYKAATYSTWTWPDPIAGLSSETGKAFCIAGWGVLAQLYESYTEESAYYNVYGAYWRSQSFTPQSSHKITSVWVKLCRVGSPGTGTISIKATDANGKPTGADLCSASINGNALPTDPTLLGFSLGAGTNLSAGTKYAIVWRFPSGNSSNYARTRHMYPGTYAGGTAVTSSDSGATWEVVTDWDFVFQDWGEALAQTIYAESTIQQIAYGTPEVKLHGLIIPTSIVQPITIGMPTIEGGTYTGQWILPPSVVQQISLGSPTVLKFVWHVVLDGQYNIESPAVNRAYVIGRDIYGNPVYGTAVDSTELALVGERLDFQQELAIPTATQANSVAQALLQKMRLTGKRGVILIPPNCGQELFDVVQITDAGANQSAVKFRVVGLRFEYSPKQARYQHKLILGAP